MCYLTVGACLFSSRYSSFHEDFAYTKFNSVSSLRKKGTRCERDDRCIKERKKGNEGRKSERFYSALNLRRGFPLLY
jgi:hypothetical protein